MSEGSRVSIRLQAMRHDFDHAFAMPAAETIESTTDLLAVRVGGEDYAVRLSEIAGLHVNLTVVPIPSPARHLLGIAAIRGVMAPVYDLGGLLGYPSAAMARWILLVKAPQTIALAFEAFQAQIRVADSLLNFNDAAESPRRGCHSRGAVQAAGAVRPILQVPALIATLRENAHDG